MARLRGCALAVLGLMGLAVAMPPSASAWQIDFEGLASGTPISSQPGLVKNSFNNMLSAGFAGFDELGNPDSLVTLDTGAAPQGSDFQGTDTFQKSDNDAAVLDPGNVLILDGENAGRIEIDFNRMTSLNLINFFDIDVNESSPPGAIQLFDMKGNEIFANTFFTPTTGNKRWDYVAFGGIAVKRIVISLQGSGAIDAIRGWDIPEPYHPAFLLLGIGAMIWLRRRRTARL